MKLPDEDQLKAEHVWLPQVVHELRQPVTASVATQLRAARQAVFHQKTTTVKPIRFAKKRGMLTWGLALATGLALVAVMLMIIL